MTEYPKAVVGWETQVGIADRGPSMQRFQLQSNHDLMITGPAPVVTGQTFTERENVELLSEPLFNSRRQTLQSQSPNVQSEAKKKAFGVHMKTYGEGGGYSSTILI
jgi:hypothetical protein